jgi:hypothetical protein
MRSEAEIRKQTVTRMRRLFLLTLNGGLWITAALAIYLYTRDHAFMGALQVTVGLGMLIWMTVIGLMAARTVYVEVTEFVVYRAIERERRDYLMRETYEKRKRDDASLRLSDDGELIDWNADEREAKAKHER